MWHRSANQEQPTSPMRNGGAGGEHACVNGDAGDGRAGGGGREESMDMEDGRSVLAHARATVGAAHELMDEKTV